jgi:hypothetical protein
MFIGGVAEVIRVYYGKPSGAPAPLAKAVRARDPNLERSPVRTSPCRPTDSTVGNNRNIDTTYGAAAAATNVLRQSAFTSRPSPTTPSAI